jgi:hypothetical protein
VWVESSQGGIYAGTVTQEVNNPPCFLIDTRTLSFDEQYKLCVVLANGRAYESDFLTPFHTPDIHAIEYVVNGAQTAVEFAVTTYGNSNASPYYKWNYTEDWEIVSKYRSRVYYDRTLNTQLAYTTDSPVYYCWGHSTSSSILIARTDHLADNIVHQMNLKTITNRDYKIGALYSMELSQMSISKEAYNYWAALQRNTDEIGGIFAPQPNDLYGNIRCVSDKGVRTIGYISAGTRSVKRIFVEEKDMGIYLPPSCDFLDMTEFTIPPTDRSLYDWGYQIVSEIVNDSRRSWVRKSCVDCTAIGTKNKPSFWPNDHK